jgi:5,10-methylenetetrahydromethanopterin reductase
LRVGVWLLADQPADVTAARARLAESVGLDFVGVTDGQMIWRDVWVSLAAVALATERVRLGPWVTNPLTRHPTVTASALCTLDELSGGRAFLGIGAGDDSVKTINEKPATHEDLLARVELIKRLSAGERVEAEPTDLTLATARPSCPTVYWAASAPRSFNFGARCGDGVIDTGWLVPKMLEDAIRWIDEGADAAGRPRDSIARIFNSGVSINDDGAEARRAAKTYAAKGLMWKRSAGVPGWSEERRKHLISNYDYSQHLATGQRAIDLVPDELITKKAVAGTPNEVVELLEMVIRAGYTDLALLPLGNVEQTIRALGDTIVPRIR